MRVTTNGSYVLADQIARKLMPGKNNALNFLKREELSFKLARILNWKGTDQFRIKF